MAITTAVPVAEGEKDFLARATSLYGRALLGAAAGGAGGMLVGGIGGRLAMLLLRFTSPDYIRGVESDDGFEMGIVSLATFNLIVTTGLLGAVAGIFVVLALTYMPWSWAPWAWAIPGATIGGAGLVHSDGVDFSLLQPHWFAVALFVAIPAAGLACIALLVRLWERWWWEDRRRTVIAAVCGLPLVIVFPVPLAVLVGGALWALLSHHEATRVLPQTTLAQRSARVAFGAVSLAFLPIFVNDVLDVL